VTGSADNGKELFKNHCRLCHAPPDINPESGLGLRYVFDRLPNPADEYFKNFVRDSYKLKKEGDPYAKKLDAENNNDYEHNFKDSISDKDILDIFAYIKNESRPVVMP
jgi:mono/diheme cytochrome c family protein